MADENLGKPEQQFVGAGFTAEQVAAMSPDDRRGYIHEHETESFNRGYGPDIEKLVDERIKKQKDSKKNPIYERSRIVASKTKWDRNNWSVKGTRGIDSKDPNSLHYIDYGYERTPDGLKEIEIPRTSDMAAQLNRVEKSMEEAKWSRIQELYLSINFIANNDKNRPGEFGPAATAPTMPNDVKEIATLTNATGTEAGTSYAWKQAYGNRVRYLYWIDNDKLVRVSDAYGGRGDKETGKNKTAGGLLYTNATPDANYALGFQAHENRTPRAGPGTFDPETGKPYEPGIGVYMGKFVRTSLTHPMNVNSGTGANTSALDTYNMVDELVRKRGKKVNEAGNSSAYELEQSMLENLFDAKSPYPTIRANISKGEKEADELAKQANISGIIDRMWVKSRFMTPNYDLKPVDRVNRYWSTAGWKHGSTRLGHHYAINPRPQFTRTADIKGNNVSFNPYNKGNHYGGPLMGNVLAGPLPPGDEFALGMGRYYSEAIDDNATMIYLQFGVPKFNSLISFFTRAVSYVDMSIANYGRVPMGYKISHFIGSWIMLRAFPLMTIGFLLLKWGMKIFFGGPFKYYYMDPTMHTYWSTVSTLVSQIATEIGILSPMFMEKTETVNKLGAPVKLNEGDMKDIAAYFPRMFNKHTNYIDVFAIATQEQLLAKYALADNFAKTKKMEDKPLSSVSGEIWAGYTTFGETTDLVSDWKQNKAALGKGVLGAVGANFSLDLLFKHLTGQESGYFYHTTTDWGNLPPDVKYTDEDPGSEKEAKANSYKAKNEDGNRAKVEKDLNKEQSKEGIRGSDGNYSLTDRWWSYIGAKVKSGASSVGKSFMSTFDSVLQGGGEYAVFITDYPGSGSDSFSNSVGEIETGNSVKSIAQGARDIRFNLAGGSLGTLVDSAKEAVVGVLNGLLDSVTFGLSNVLRTITGGAYVDIPKKWNDSDMNLATTSYTIDLVSPYGNPFSQLQNIYIPLCMLLAGVLPLRAGEASYTSPFLCTLFNKGHQDIQLGMITELSVEKGITNLPYNKWKKCMSFRVNFTVTDFSTRITAPVNSTAWKQVSDSLNFSLEDENPMDTWLATIASRDLYTTKYVKRKFVQKVSRFIMACNQGLSVAGNTFRTGEFIKGAPILGQMVTLFSPEKSLPPSQSNAISPMG